jgi:hypothetical protein
MVAIGMFLKTAGRRKKDKMMTIPWAEIIYIAADFIPSYMFCSVAHVSHDFLDAISRYTADGEMLIIRSIDGESALFFNGHRRYRREDVGVCPMTGQRYRDVICDVVTEMYKHDMVMTLHADDKKVVQLSHDEREGDSFPWIGYGEVIEGNHNDISVGDVWKIVGIDGEERVITVGRAPGYVKGFSCHEKYVFNDARHPKKIFIAYGQIFMLAKSVDEDAEPLYYHRDEPTKHVDEHYWYTDDVVDIICPLRSDVIKSWTKK